MPKKNSPRTLRSKSFKKYFLLEFTKELIRATSTYKNLKIEKEVKIVVQQKQQPEIFLPTVQKGPIKKEDVHIVVKDKIKRDSRAVSRMKREDPFAAFFAGQKKPLIKKRIAQRLRIPEPRLPATVQHLRPLPTKHELDLGKLNSLVRDPMVRIIESNGPNQKIVVMGTMGRKNTSISLNKEEIDFIIKSFSHATKIPVQEGIFKVVFGRLVLSAIVSDIVGSRFTIQKMPGPPVSFG